ncbi:MAG: antirestriction protein ArdA [Symploca sp. SIO3C6]|nr:antirestriction protein ArdA [Symploca sp. SIO3C6]
MMTRQKGILTSDPNLAHDLAYQIRAEQDFNAVIFPQKIDNPALELARNLTGISFRNSCRIGARCRLKASNQKAPRIYVVCNSTYNSGLLHGCWIDCDQEPDEIWLDIKHILPDFPTNDTPEWTIYNYENFGSIHISQYEDINQLSLWANLISEHPEDKDAVAAYISWAKETGLEISSSEFQSRYCGYWDKGKDFALKSEEIEQAYNWSQFEKDYTFWSRHIDWESVVRDLELSNAYHYARADHGIYVFRYC